MTRKVELTLLQYLEMEQELLVEDRNEAELCSEVDLEIEAAALEIELELEIQIEDELCFVVELEAELAIEVEVAYSCSRPWQLQPH